MSALVVTVLIIIVWAVCAAAGYTRGGWREVVTLAGLLLSGAMVAEWAAPNGADLAGLFGGDVYRSTTAVAFLYLLGGVLLLGYLGGSRLPRPAPLSATERFAGGLLGFFNGGLLAALGLRALRAYTFRPGDGAILAETPLAAFLTGGAGYLIAAAMLAGAVAPVVSLALRRGSPPTAEYADEPALDPLPYAPQEEYAPFPAQAQPAPFTPRAAFAPPPAVPYVPVAPPASPAFPPPGMAGPPRTPPPLVPAAPDVPAVAAAVTLPTPALPPAPAVAAPPEAGDDIPGDDIPTVALAVPSHTANGSTPAPEPRPAPPPGFGITASQPLPVVAPKEEETAEPHPAPEPEAEPAAPPVAAVAPEETTDDTNDTNDRERTGPDGPPDLLPPFAVEHPPHRPEDDGPPAVPPPDTHAPEDRAPAPNEQEPEAPGAERAAALVPPATPPATLPAPPEQPHDTQPDAVPRAARARVAAVRQPPPPPKPLHMTVPPEMQRPVQPGPQMHPCPVCDYPVRNEARFCPNCGTAQPAIAAHGN